MRGNKFNKTQKRTGVVVRAKYLTKHLDMSLSSPKMIKSTVYIPKKPYSDYASEAQNSEHLLGTGLKLFETFNHTPSLTK